MWKIIAAIVVAAAVSALGVISYPLTLAPQASARFLNIAYGDLSNRQRLDLYLPDGTAPFPIIVYIHGGGFKAGNKRVGDARHIIRAALDRGYAVASINYRRSGEATFPAAVDDVFAAIRFLRTHSQAYGLLPDQMATWGASAGGNLAAMAATLGTAEDGTNVQAAINWFGPIEFGEMDAQFDALGLEPRLGPTSDPGSPESLYIGMNVGLPTAAELVRRASPQSHITPDDPPMLVQHGTADRNVPFTQSETFAVALAEVIGPQNVEFTAFPGAGHGGDEFLTDENFAFIFDFLDRHLAP